MKISVLIGFQYKYPVFLPGILVDLYQAYKQAIKMRSDKILIITDIDEDVKTEILMKAIVDEIVDADILTFIETIKIQKYHKLYDNLQGMLENIAEQSYGESSMFFYYTGHSRNGDLILPDDAKIKKTDVRDLLCTCVKKDGDIFIVMDCCYGSGLRLPFRMTLNQNREGIYKLNKEEKVIFTSQRIICLSASSSDETSITNHTGSLFTRALFSVLKLKIRSLTELLYKVNNICLTKHRQTLSIYSSYPNIFVIWGWIYGQDKYEVCLDTVYNTLIIYDQTIKHSLKHMNDEVDEICTLKLQY